MKFIDKLLSLIFFGLALTFFAVISIITIIQLIGSIIEWAKNSYFSFGCFEVLFTGILSLAACALIILISVFSGLKILQGEKLRGLNLFKAIVSIAVVFAGVTCINSIMGLIVGIVDNYGGTFIASEIIDIILYAGATVVGVMAYMAKSIDFQKKLFAMISFGLCGLATFIGFFFGFSFLGIIFFSIWGLGVAINILNNFEEGKKETAEENE